jgi:tryptophan 7-halogenase
MKRISIIGSGTAGTISSLILSRINPDSEIILYHDPNKPPQAVGEGSDIKFPIMLRDNMKFTHSQLPLIDGTIKCGIKKVGWSGCGNFSHDFAAPNVSYHFNANKLQKYILSSIREKITVIEKEVKIDDIDSDFIIDCTGSPKTFDDFNISKATPVNACFVTQCFWDFSRFNYTGTIARPYGWVFLIPLVNRCSVGYLFNRHINNLDEIKEDVKNIFLDYDLIPSETTNYLEFSNYFRKENFDGRVMYNGNASFFIEPIEATTIGVIINNIRRINNYIKDPSIGVSAVNSDYINNMASMEFIISMHYIGGSKFNTKFWGYAKALCLDTNTKLFSENERFRDVIQNAINKNEFSPMINDIWAVCSYRTNLSGFGLIEHYQKLLNQYK